MNKEYTWIDNFRLVAAFLVVAIHMGPLLSINESMDYYIVYCLGRVGVPFFIAVSGYFMLSGSNEKRSLQKILKLTGLYVLATVLYLPISIYAGNVPRNIGGILKWILFDGTFYHLWYLPAVIIGALLVMGMHKIFSEKITILFCVVLYVIGVFGDSYYGLACKIPALKQFYDGIFVFSSYTRNGLFIAPIFLVLGRMLRKYQSRMNLMGNIVGLIVSLVLLLAEGGITRHYDWQKHNSMYLFLIPVMFFLMLLLVRKEEEEKNEKYRQIREISLWIYLLHPLSIVLIRGVAGKLQMKELLVQNSLMFYLTVCGSTLLVAEMIVWVKGMIGKVQRERV